MEIFLVFFCIIVLGIIPLIFLIRILGFVYPFLFWGGIDVSTTKEKVKKMVEFLDIKPGQKAVDLGSGEGRLFIALAKAGAKAYGFEINPFLVSHAKKNIKEAGLEESAFVSCKNFWHQNLKDFDMVAVFPMAHMMEKLEKKFDRELKPQAKVVINYFKLPTWKPDRAEDDVYLYIKK